MGGSGKNTPSKAPKTPAVAEEPQPQSQPVNSSPVPSTGVYPDWPGYQAYSPYPPGHPYMWGPQPMMAPYGTPPPPYVMYPPGVYPHPSMPPGSHPFSPYAMPSSNGNVEASGSVQVGAEADGKSSEGKKGGTITKSSEGKKGGPITKSVQGKKGGSITKSPEGKKGGPITKSSEGKKGGPITRSKTQGIKVTNSSKKSGASANGAYSQSGESGSGDSGDSDAESENDSQEKAHGELDSSDAGRTQNGSSARVSENGLAIAPSQGMLNPAMPMMSMLAAATYGAIGPTTNLNMGMDYWGSPTPSTIPPVHGETPANPVTGAAVPGVVPGPRESIPSEPWVNDEREQKRQKRKQSNRESARRSRLRKQAECEEIAQRLDFLKGENMTLNAELERIKKEHNRLVAHNASLKERVSGSEDSGADKMNQGYDAVEDHTNTAHTVS